MEGKKKKIIWILIGMLVIQANLLAQRRDSIVKRNTLRAQANLSGGYLFQQRKAAAYISGNLEYYINERFSVKGEAWCSFDIIKPEEIGLRKNFSGFAGLNYHPVKYSRWDPYIGFSAGIGLLTTNYWQDTLIRESPVQFSPLISATAGLNYYIGSIFHFFVECKFVAGGTNSATYGRTFLEELKFSGGLGWNFVPRKKKKTTR